jgi:hypothetical protein
MRSSPPGGCRHTQGTRRSRPRCRRTRACLPRTSERVRTSHAWANCRATTERGYGRARAVRRDLGRVGSRCRSGAGAARRARPRSANAAGGGSAARAGRCRSRGGASSTAARRGRGDRSRRAPTSQRRKRGPRSGPRGRICETHVAAGHRRTRGRRELGERTVGASRQFAASTSARRCGNRASDDANHCLLSSSAPTSAAARAWRRRPAAPARFHEGAIDDSPPLRLDSRHDRAEPLVAGGAGPLLRPFYIAPASRRPTLEDYGAVRRMRSTRTPSW